MHPAIAQHLSGISAICQRYGIRRLEVFGSAARADDFDPEQSDADFLVEFAPGVQPGPDTFFGAKAALEVLLGRSVETGHLCSMTHVSTVWHIAQTSLAPLLDAVQTLLDELNHQKQ